jgi:regulator of sirC expression with transglutaminase-like and TPR domain
MMRKISMVLPAPHGPEPAMHPEPAPVVEPAAALPAAGAPAVTETDAPAATETGLPAVAETCAASATETGVPVADVPITDAETPGGPQLLESRQPRLRALFELLLDDSPRVVAAVQSEFASMGRAPLGALRRAALDTDPRRRARARATLLALQREIVLRRLVRRAARADASLEGALFLLSRYAIPELDARPYRRALAAMAVEVRARAQRCQDPLEAALQLSGYLAGELGYSGDRDDYHQPDNVLLHRTIERRRGMPLTLCAIYACVAERAGLRSACVPLPGHVMLRLYAGNRSVLLDPFDGGRARTRRECEEYLTRNGLAVEPAWFQDARPDLLLQRHTMNLARSYQGRGLEREARELYAAVRNMSALREARAHAEARAARTGPRST